MKTKYQEHIINVCRNCGKGYHDKCTGRLMTSKKNFFRKNKKEESTNIICECACHEIVDGGIYQFEGKFGIDIRETRY